MAPTRQSWRDSLDACALTTASNSKFVHRFATEMRALLLPKFVRRAPRDMVGIFPPMTPMPRVARAPHTSKIPDRCPHCGSHVLTRRGTRRKKLEIVQLWRCASCKRTFTPGPAACATRPIPCASILDALSTYSLGYSLEDTVARIKSRAGRKIGSSTLAGWLAEHNDLMSYRRLRESGRHAFPAAQTIRSIKLYHRQIYGYAFHRRKLELLRRGELDDKRTATHASHRSPISWKRFRSSVRTSSSAPKNAGAHRKRVRQFADVVAHHRQSQRECGDARSPA